jgi:hypothetical protein
MTGWSRRAWACLDGAHEEEVVSGDSEGGKRKRDMGRNEEWDGGMKENSEDREYSSYSHNDMEPGQGGWWRVGGMRD